jgi:RNA polymerase sigma-70 factor (ECF subfamily)
VSRTRIDSAPTPADDTDQSLVARAKAGDVEAYGCLVARYQRVVLRAAVALGAGDAAEDAAQDAFVSAWQALDRFDEARPFRPWIVAIVANAVRHRQRSRRRGQAVVDTVAAQPQPVVRGGDEAAVADEERRLLLAAVRRLPERQRLVVTYRYLLQLSEAETAAALGWPAGTVKSRLSRGLHSLRADPTLTDLLDAP